MGCNCIGSNDNKPNPNNRGVPMGNVIKKDDKGKDEPPPPPAIVDIMDLANIKEGGITSPEEVKVEIVNDGDGSDAPKKPVDPDKNMKIDMWRLKDHNLTGDDTREMTEKDFKKMD